MIVALARKLLIALWRLVTTGEVPDGVELRTGDVRNTLAASRRLNNLDYRHHNRIAFLWTVWRSSVVSRLGGKRVDRPCRRINPRPLVRFEEGGLRTQVH
jgi:hypothetical protein